MFKKIKSFLAAVLTVLKFLVIIAVFLGMLVLMCFISYDVIQARKSGEFVPTSHESPF